MIRLAIAALLVGVLLALGSALQQATPGNPPAGEAARGAVLGVYDAGGAVVDARTARQLALFVAADEAVTPFVAAGRRDLELRFSATLELERSDRYRLHAYGNGALRVQVDDDPALALDPTAEGTASDPLRLRKGPHGLVLHWTPPATGDAVLRLWWSGRDSGPQPIPGQLLSHDPSSPVLVAGLQRRHGRDLVARLRCAACHHGIVPEADGMPRLRPSAPSLVDLGARLHPGWIASWLQDPAAHRGDATMPALLHLADGEPAQAARDLAAALVATGEPQAAPAGDAARGRELFGRRNCFACHDRGAVDPAEQGWGGRVSLAEVGAKWQPAALAAFLQDPGHHYPDIRMPDVDLSAAEAADLAAFLLGDTSPAPFDPAAADAARGATLLETLHCTRCHDGEPAALPLEDLAAGCLAPQPAAAPRFALDAADRADITRVLAEHRDSFARHVPAEHAARTWRDLRCDACHQRDGVTTGMVRAEAQARELGIAIDDPHRRIPELSQLGAKLDPEWVAGLLRGDHEHRTRPYLEVRMPTFPAYADDLAPGLAREEGFGPVAPPAAPPPADQVALGRSLAGGGGYQCRVCHGFADQPPLAAFEAPAPNLSLTAGRLRHGWYHRWMRDPQAIDPGTRMPRFTLPDDPERALRQDVAEGSAQIQFEAIWQYLRDGWELEPPQ